MNQYMQPLQPMQQPQQSGGMGGLSSVLGMFMDKKRQDGQDQKLQAMITALRNPGDLGAMAQMAPSTATTLPTQGMPPMMGFEY